MLTRGDSSSPCGSDDTEATSKARLLGMGDASGFRDKIVVLLESTSDTGITSILSCAVAGISLPLEPGTKKVELRAFDEEDIETGAIVCGSISVEPIRDYTCYVAYQQRASVPIASCIGVGTFHCYGDPDEATGIAWRDLGCVVSHDLNKALIMSESEVWSSLTLQHASLYRRRNLLPDDWRSFNPTWVYANKIDAVTWANQPGKCQFRRQLWCQGSLPEHHELISQTWQNCVADVGEESIRVSDRRNIQCFDFNHH
mmetsp:Transcript_402/g.1066  ORF Transcript_402/g.1066 Transcript_402/m.1066 type:complete len:257 (+) Transcript_402:3-773(+)